MGACRSDELYNMKIQEVKDLGTTFLITVPKTKTKVVRTFTINDHFYEIVKKYINLRPSHVIINSLFLNYQKSKCTIQRIGKNKFATIGKQIAAFLKLPDPQQYTGHCYRRSSATLYVDGGGDLTGLKRHGGWKSSQVAEGYIEESFRHKNKTAKTIINQVYNSEASSSNSTTVRNETITVEGNSANNINIPINSSIPNIQFFNCNHINIHFVEK